MQGRVVAMIVGLFLWLRAKHLENNVKNVNTLTELLFVMSSNGAIILLSWCNSSSPFFLPNGPIGFTSLTCKFLSWVNSYQTTRTHNSTNQDPLSLSKYHPPWAIQRYESNNKIPTHTSDTWQKTKAHKHVQQFCLSILLPRRSTNKWEHTDKMQSDEQDLCWAIFTNSGDSR